MSDKQLNVFDEVIEVCCTNPITGFYRDGFCHTDEFDRGMHVVCAKVTNDFLNFSNGVFVLKDGKKLMNLVLLLKFS